MAERLEAAFFGLLSSAAAAWLIYALATGDIAGPGWALLAAVNVFAAVGHAARLALLARLPLVTIHGNEITVNESAGESKGGGKR